MNIKTMSFKADETGQVSGYFSTYDEEPDSYGDIVAPGAFDDTIKARNETGHPFPLCFNHNMDAVIGKVDSVEDTEKGPLITASFFNTPKAQEVREMVKSGAVFQFSFAYEIRETKEPTPEQKGKGIVQVLTKVDLFEVSIVVVPANQNAVVTEIKSGRRNSKADSDKLEQAISLIRDVLGQLDDMEEDQPNEEDQAKSNAPEAKETEPDNSKRDELLLRVKNILEV